jgi:hypothetical protein
MSLPARGRVAAATGKTIDATYGIYKLNRRIAKYEQDRPAGIPWEQVKADLLKREIADCLADARASGIFRMPETKAVVKVIAA